MNADIIVKIRSAHVSMDIFSVKINRNPTGRNYFPDKELLILPVNQDQHNFYKLVTCTNVEYAADIANTNLTSFTISSAIL